MSDTPKSARRSTRKRSAPMIEPIETPDTKRAKKSPPVSTRSKKSEDHKINQSYWIRLHYYLMRHAVVNHRPLTALSGTASCAYFNAYWQGYLGDPENGIGKPVFPFETFRNFDQTRRQLLPNVIGQVEQESLENVKRSNTREYCPIIKPSLLAQFRILWDDNQVKTEIDWNNPVIANTFNKFFDTIVSEQSDLTKPAWPTDGEHNLNDRPKLRMTTCPSDNRMWSADVHSEDPKYGRDPKDLHQIIGSGGETEYFPIRHRRVHADVGNALLNMAIMRPAGNLGDLKSLGKDPRGDDLPNMSEDQRQNFHEHIRMVQQGNDLQKSLYEKAGWTVEDDEKTGEDEDGDVLLQD